LELEGLLEVLEVLEDFDLPIGHVHWKLPIKFLYYWNWPLEDSNTLPMLPIIYYNLDILYNHKKIFLISSYGKSYDSILLDN
jgi:hypothetical protein